ncbi:MAG: DUF3794 domain-containing protein [Clostridia bacterium]|nr:DUF3794 domain-containing protein [Clostridia bacterium]
MGSEMKKEILSFWEEKEKLKGERAIDTELTLPDYCKDIKRILRCTLTPQVQSVSTTGEKISVRGTALIRVIYADDKENIDCCEKSTDFSLSLQSSQTDGRGVALAHAVTDYVNCRAVSRRKVSINGSIGVLCRVLSKSFTEIPTAAPEGVETSKNKRTQLVAVCMGEKSFEMSETVALSKETPSVGKIIYTNAWVETESLRAVQDKLLIKGELCVRTVYLSEGEENKVETHMHRMPLSQIMDIEGIDEGCEITARCRIGQLNVTAKSDSSESGRLIDISARINCFVTGEKATEYEYISDCYCTAGRYAPEYSERQTVVPLLSQRRSIRLKKSVQLPSAGEISHVWAGDCSADAKVSEGAVHGKIKLTACILYLDENKSPAFCERELDFDCDTELNEECSSPVCSFDVQIRDIKASSDKDGSAELTVEALTEIRVSELFSDRYVCELKECSPENKKRPALTVYYCDGGEKLWDIAKRYSTTVALIKSENGIDGDTVSKKRMLLIPCV